MPGNKYIGVGSNWTLTVGCTNINGTYTWLFNTNVVLNSTNNVLALSNVTTNNSGVYSLVLSNIAGVATGSVTLSVFNPPTIVAQPPTSTALPAGTNLQLVVGATGTSLSYQWSKNGAVVTGATNSTLSITNLAAAHSGKYSLLITNQIGSVTSQSSTLTVITTPLIGQLPAKYLNSGTTWTILFPCTNIAGTYSWFYNGTNPLVSFTNSYTLTNSTSKNRIYSWC